jgi:hypothetical protein
MYSHRMSACVSDTVSVFAYAYVCVSMYIHALTCTHISICRHNVYVDECVCALQYKKITHSMCTYMYTHPYADTMHIH